jgi:hypothetical protein
VPKVSIANGGKVRVRFDDVAITLQPDGVLVWRGDTSDYEEFIGSLMTSAELVFLASEQEDEPRPEW